MADKEVQLHELLFTLSWEDPELDRRAFAPMAGERIATVASGGCNALTFLLDDPAYVFAFDYNPTQVWTTELKRLAVRELDDAGVYELLGVRESTRRDALMAKLEPFLDPEAKAWWASQPWLIENGLHGGGRYERFVGLFRKLLRLIQGRKTIDRLFEPRTRDERVAFYDEVWNGFAFSLLFKAFFNKAVLSRRGLSPEYFTFDDGSTSFAESFARRTRHALTEIDVRDNPFVAQYVLGRYLDEEHLPEWLRPESLAILRERVDRLEVRQGDVRTVFDDDEDGAYRGVCLSNVFELMSEAQTAEVLPRVARVVPRGGRVTLRNLMVPRGVDDSTAHLLHHEVELSRELQQQDRSFVYRACHVYTRTEAAHE